MLVHSWFDNINTGWIICFIWLSLSVTAFLFYKIGMRQQNSSHINISDIIPNSILGLLALILGFSFSMVISRFEHRRELAIEEGNAISTAYLRATLLKNSNSELSDLFRGYIDARISAYDDQDSERPLKEAQKYQTQIWNHFKKMTRTERGALESAYVFALNEMFDSASARNFALQKSLPMAIYGAIFLMCLIAIAALNYDRGYRKEANHWRSFLLILLFGLVFGMVYDLDHPKKGLIQISQDALIGVKESL